MNLGASRDIVPEATGDVTELEMPRSTSEDKEKHTNMDQEMQYKPGVVFGQGFHKGELPTLGEVQGAEENREEKAGKASEGMSEKAKYNGLDSYTSIKREAEDEPRKRETKDP